MDVFEEYTLEEWRRWLETAGADQLGSYSKEEWQTWISWMEGHKQSLDRMAASREEQHFVLWGINAKARKRDRNQVRQEMWFQGIHRKGVRFKSAWMPAWLNTSQELFKESPCYILPTGCHLDIIGVNRQAFANTQCVDYMDPRLDIVLQELALCAHDPEQM